MTLSIKGGGGIINEVPKVSGLKVTAFEQNTIDIEYKVEDVELTICRHYLLLNGVRTEITKQVGYESDTNVFKYKITGLKMNTPYTIQIAASDGHDEGLSQAIQQTTKKLPLFGVRVMENNSNPSTCVTYIESAVGVQVANSNSLGGWANEYPFNKIRLVGFKAGKITKEINPNNKAQYKDGSTVPSDVDVMVEIPKVYWKFNDISNGYELRICDRKVDSSYDCFAHKVGGVEKDFIYVGAYLGYNEGNKIRSKSGVVPTGKISLTNSRTYARNNGQGYQLFNWFTLILLQVLYLIAYKNLNSQAALGMGYVEPDGSGYKQTGGTNSKGMIFGEQSGAQQMCFLGIEDLWGNMEQWCDGIFCNSTYNLMVTPDNKTFNDNRNNYVNIGKFVNGIGDGYIRKVAHTNKAGFFGKEFDGSGTTHYCDVAFIYREGFARYGCTTSGDNGGIFMLQADAQAGYANDFLSCRLCYLG